MENKVEVVITRDELENVYTRVFTDKEWEVLAGEIESLLEYWIEADVPHIVANLDNLVEQDSKSD